MTRFIASAAANHSAAINNRNVSAPNAPARHLHRERDFGVGYGNSSGYASTRRYTNQWATPRFRMT